MDADLEHEYDTARGFADEESRPFAGISDYDEERMARADLAAESADSLVEEEEMIPCPVCGTLTLIQHGFCANHIDNYATCGGCGGSKVAEGVPCPTCGGDGYVSFPREDSPASEPLDLDLFI